MKVLVADDDKTIGLITKALLVRKGVTVVSATDGVAANEILFDGSPPDLAILNCSLPKADGLELCKKLQEHPNVNYTNIILVSNGELKEVFSSLVLGIGNILMKPINHEEVVGMMNDIQFPKNPSDVEDAEQPAMYEPLTKRQREILQMLAQGHSNNEIAQKLGVAIGTIKAHVHHIFSKLSAGSRTKALIKAARLGLL